MTPAAAQIVWCVAAAIAAGQANKETRADSISVAWLEALKELAYVGSSHLACS